MEDRPSQHWEEAHKALARADFAAASGHLQRCLEAWPLHAEAHFLLARTSRRAGDRIAWQIHLRRAEALQWPRDEITFERTLFRAQTGDLWSAVGPEGRHVEDVLLARLDAPGTDEVIVLEALVQGYLENNSSNDALRWTRYWTEHYPDDWEGYLFRGQACLADPTPERALAAFRRAVELNPEAVEPRFRLGAALAADGRWDEALAQYRFCLEVEADNPTALLGLANCQHWRGERAEARTALDRLLAQRPNQPAALLIRGRLEYDDENYDAALDWLQKAEKAAPNEPEVFVALARTLRALGRGDEAEVYDRKFKVLEKKLRELEDVRKQISREPSRVDLRYQAGALLLEIGQEPEAARWFQSVLRLDPNHRPTCKLLADYYQKTGDERRAEHFRRKAEGRPPEKQGGS
jgi:tetratricopeptide (TPR) repeat protein